MMFPHRIIRFLFDVCGLEFAPSDLPKFWYTAIANGVPGADATSRNRVPLGFYGDSAQLLTRVRKEKLTCFFLNLPLFRPRSIRCSRFLLWACDTALLYFYQEFQVPNMKVLNQSLPIFSLT